jgi:hypothetical protein
MQLRISEHFFVNPEGTHCGYGIPYPELGPAREGVSSGPTLFFALTSCTALKSFWFVVFVDSSIDRLGRLQTIVSHHGLDL